MKKFEYNITLNTKDIWIFSLYNANKNFLGLFNIFFSFASVYFLVVSWSYLSINKKIIYLICASMFTIIQPAILYLKALKQANSERIKKGYKIIFSDENIEVSQEEQVYTAKWEEVYKTLISKRQIVVFFAPLRGYLIPKRYLQEDRIEFENLLREKTKVVRF